MNWEYLMNDQVVGPHSEESMKELHSCGMLAGDTLVRREGTEEWLPFDKAFEKVVAPQSPLIKFHCPKCDTKIAAEPADVGTSANCPSCGIELVVPPIEASQPPTARPSDPESQRGTDDSAAHPLETNELTSNSVVDLNKAASGEVSSMHKFGTTLASFAKSASHEVKLNSQIAVLKTRIENAKQIELRKAHYALGRKLYELRILLSMQEEIEELERQIAEKGERAVIEENETRAAMLKRFGKNAAKSAESELLSLKLKQTLTRLGELARRAQQTSFPGAETEIEACSTGESKIRNLADEIALLVAGKKVIINALPNNEPTSIRNKIVDLPDHAALSGEDNNRDTGIDHPEYYEESRTDISAENLQVTSPQVLPAVSAVGRFVPAFKPQQFTGNLSGAAFSLPRLIPLFVCCLLFGWVAGGWLMPDLAFTSSNIIGQLIPVAMLAVPAITLAVFGIIFFLRPTRFPRKEAIGVLFFTMLVGLAGLLIFQFIANFTLHHMPNHPRGKIGLIVVIVAAIGQAYNSIGSTSAIEQFFGYIFGVGLCEEATKLLPLFFFALARGNSSSKIKFREFLVIAFFSGLGFGIGEAIYGYSPWNGNLMAGSNVTRWFACVPSHAIYTVIDAAFLWFLFPKILGAKNNYIRFAICALTVFTVAVVHGIYDVLCRFPYMGFVIDAASIFLMYFVVVWVAKKTGVAGATEEYKEEVSKGILGWLCIHKAGRMRFGRIYATCSILIVSSLVFSKSLSQAHGQEDKSASHGTQSQDLDLKQKYYQLGYSVGANSNTSGASRSNLEFAAEYIMRCNPEIDSSYFDLILLGVEDGYGGRSRRY